MSTFPKNTSPIDCAFELFDPSEAELPVNDPTQHLLWPAVHRAASNLLVRCPFPSPHNSLVFDDPDAAAQGFDFDLVPEEFSLDTPAGMADAKYMKLAAALRSTIEASGHTVQDLLPYLSSPVPSPAQSAVSTETSAPLPSSTTPTAAADDDGPTTTAFDDSAALDLDLAFFTEPHHQQSAGVRAPTYVLHFAAHNKSCV